MKNKHCKHCARVVFDSRGNAMCDKKVGITISLKDEACCKFEPMEIRTDCVNFSVNKCNALCGHEILCKTEACRFYK